MRTRFLPVFLLLLIPPALLSLPAGAQDNGEYLSSRSYINESRPQISMDERAVFVFNKLAGATPDYERWIMESAPYLKASTPEGKAKALEEELLRLKLGFALHDIDKDLLTVDEEGTLELKMDDKTSKPVLSFRAPMHEKRMEAPYFPFHYGQQWIALILEEMGAFTDITLNSAQFDTISRQIQPNQLYPGVLRMRARGKRADNKDPLKIQGFMQWGLLGEIGRAEMIYTPLEEDAEPIVLWSYDAPWYKTEEEKDLLPLLQQQSP